MIVTPIDVCEQERVTERVNHYIEMSSRLFKRRFSQIEVRFDLKGRAAGMYQTRRNRGFFSSTERFIRFNPWLFAKYPEDSFENTIPHEVAHYVSDCLFGLSKIRPHGKEWRSIMQSFGAEPSVHGQYDLEGIPVRKVQRFPYACGCREVSLTIHRHKKVQKGQQLYQCRDCRTPLVYQGAG